MGAHMSRLLDSDASPEDRTVQGLVGQSSGGQSVARADQIAFQVGADVGSKVSAPQMPDRPASRHSEAPSSGVTSCPTWR